MTNLEINQLLHERVMELEWYPLPVETGLDWHPLWPKYTSSWADYGRLLEVAMTKEWWDDVAYGKALWQGFKVDTILNPLRGSTAMAEFVKERGI